MIQILRSRLPIIIFILYLQISNALAQPVITGAAPASNQRNVSRNAAVTVDFSQPLTAGSANALRVFSNQRGGLRTGNSGTNTVNGNRLIFGPAYDFRPGEIVQATVTRNAQSSSGALAQPRTYQFITATTGGSGIFINGGDVAVGERPYIVVTADVDGDGDLDLLTPNFYGSSVSVRLNNGNATFAGRTEIFVGSQPRGLVMSDLDGDGDLDFATSNYNANTMTVRLNNGSGGFAGGGDFTVGSQPQSIVAADLDGDGDQDLLVSNGAGNDVSVRLNNGNATFSTAPNVPVIDFPFSLTVGDVDGDGDIDLIAGNYYSNTVSIRLNNGAGAFSGSNDVVVGSAPRGVALADIDSDGDLDMLAANANSNTVSVRLNNGMGIFSGVNSVAVGNFPGSVTMADVDSDGDLDLLTTNINSNTVSVRLNNGSGGFGGGSEILVGSEPYRVAAADLDNDGDLDLLAANFSDNTVSVRLNQPPPPQVRIVGDSVVCSGGQVQLTATGPVPILAYRWSTGATTASIAVTQPGTYGVSVTFSGGTVSTAQYRVTAITPTVRIASDSVVCGGQAVSLTAIAPGARAYRWSTGATTAAINVNQPGVYDVTASYGAGCAATARVVVRAPALLVTGTAVLCATAGASTMLTAAAPGATSLRWNTGNTTATQTVTQAGTYSVVATFPSGCVLTASQVVSRPVAAVSGDSVLCAGRPAQLMAALPGVATAAATYRWNTGATTPTISLTQPGTYSVVIDYGTGCVSTVRRQVRAGFAVPAFSLGADTVLCDGEQVVLVAPAQSRPGLGYRWSDGSAGATLRVLQTGTYSLQITGECDSRTVNRRVDYRPCLTIPNVFTPNEDGRNDRFRVEGLAGSGWTLDIYSRWGKKVYETTAYQNDWGQQAAAGIYYYVLRRNNNPTPYKGWVEVIR